MLRETDERHNITAILGQQLENMEKIQLPLGMSLGGAFVMNQTLLAVCGVGIAVLVGVVYVQRRKLKRAAHTIQQLVLWQAGTMRQQQADTPL